jgi:hypothetical protein
VAREERGFQLIELVEVDARSGAARRVLMERNPTYAELYLDFYDGKPNVRVLESGEVLWYSERDGWAHLYLYDGATGALKNQVTRGEWVVRDVEHVDESNRKI